MGSSFFGLGVAASGLNAAQAQLNTASQNISNINTKGYTKQVTNLVASSAMRSYQSWGTIGTGVDVVSVTSLRDEYYDKKYWNNNTNLGFYDKMDYYMTQIEDYFTDSSANSGYTTIYSKMFNSMSSLKSNAGDSSVRNQFISNAKELMDFFNETSKSLQGMQITINDEIKATVDQINASIQKIALINQQINTIETGGGHANELRDQRATILDELSSLIPVEAKEVEITNSNDPSTFVGATYFTLKVNGQLLIDNYHYNNLACKAREQLYNQSDVEGLYDVVWEETGNTFDTTGTSMSGALKALFEVRDGNNAENLTGHVDATTNTSISIKDPSIKDVLELNMPQSGVVKVNSNDYTYSSFEVKTNAEGEIEEVIFNLDNPLQSKERTNLLGKRVEVGSTMDYMGIPYYLNEMNTFLRSFTREFNDIEKQGQDLYGNQMESFFVAKNMFTGGEYAMDTNTVDTTFSSNDDSIYLMTAINARVAQASLDDPKKFSTTVSIQNGVDSADLISKLEKLESQTPVYRSGAGDKFLQCIYADLTVDVQQCQLFQQNYTALNESINNMRESIAGVDQDEEALDLIKYQNAYNLASKCISVMNEVYDRLITQTGV